MIVVWVFGAGVNCAHLLRQARGWRRWLVAPSSLCVAIGACGFFGCGLSAVGALNWLGPSFEWPAGFVEDTLRTPDGWHIVLQKPAGRVQIYDGDWHFVRGWPVVSPLKLGRFQDGNIEVLTKGLRGMMYDLNGSLLSQRKFGVNEFVNLENSLPREAHNVPTSPWLYIFSSPFLSWLVAAAGLVGWFVISPRPQKMPGSSGFSPWGWRKERG